MAYQAKRPKRFQEDFELVDGDGNVVHTLNVSLDADDMVAKINRKYTALTKALAETTEIKRNTQDPDKVQGCVEALGRAVVDLLEAVFGEEDAKTVVEFYEGRYIEMSQEVLPFITQHVIPKLTEMRKDNKKAVLRGYNRKTRGRLFC